MHTARQANAVSVGTFRVHCRMFNETNWVTTHFLFGTHSSLLQFLCSRMLTFISKQINLKDTAAAPIPVTHLVSRWPQETPGRVLGLTSVVTQWEDADLPWISKGVQVHLLTCVCVSDPLTQHKSHGAFLAHKRLNSSTGKWPQIWVPPWASHFLSQHRWRMI